MRVMCINSKGWFHGSRSYDGPKYGDTNTVTEEIELLGKRAYGLAGYEHFFHAKCFIPLSDTDPLEEIKEEEVYESNVH